MSAVVGVPAAAPPLWRALRCSLWNLVAVAGVSCVGMGGAVLAEPLEETEHKRAHDPLSVVLWSPPPALAAGSDVIYDEAQWGSPDAPFVFLGDTLRIGGSFESSRPLLIGEQARIDVLEGAELRLSGSIANDGGSRLGLAKLGAGVLELSGANSYRGNTLLLQGTLRVAGNQALGALTRSLNVNTGTVLEYAPGVRVENAVQLQAENIAAHVPAGEWTPLPPDEYADRVRWVVAEGEAEHAGLLAGTAPFVKQGAGRLRLGGDALAYWGSALVQEGAMAVDTTFSGAVTVAPAARLEGSGSVAAATVQPGGVLAPGDAGGGIGQLRVQGDLVLQGGARYEVDAGPAGAADRLLVGGKALLDGHVAVLAQAGDWQPQTRYTVLSADGGLQGSRFASVGSNFAFLQPELDYDEKQVYLTLRRNDVPFDDVADDPDEEELADAIEEDGPQGGGGGSAGGEQDGDQQGDQNRDQNGCRQASCAAAGTGGVSGLYERIVVLDRSQAREALRQLSGSWGGSLWSAMVEDSRYVRQAVLDAANPYSVLEFALSSGSQSSLPYVPSRPPRGGNSAESTGAAAGGELAESTGAAVGGEVSRSAIDPASAAGPLRFWARAFQASADRAGSGGTAGDGRDTQGLVLGLTRELAQDTAAGLYLGFQRSRLHRADGLADASIDSTHAGLSLAGRGAGGLYVLGAGYAWQRLRSARRIAVGAWRDDLRDGYRAGLFQVFGEWSLPLSLARGMAAKGAATHAPSAEQAAPRAGSMQAGSMHAGSIQQGTEAPEAGFIQPSAVVHDTGSIQAGATALDAGTMQAGVAVLEPFVRLAWVRADTGGHAESGGDAALDVRPSHTATWFGTLGLRITGTVAGPLGPVRLRAAAGWRRAGGDLQALTEQSFRHSARHASFHAQGQPIRRDAWTLDLGLRASLARDAELSLAYAGQFGSGASDHGATLSLHWRF
ncbi:autotransporter domain-containing protein [Candidimonas nitroreducens]|nr:autotransporter domain-containing protein [Candidimonas nitroreducens]